MTITYATTIPIVAMGPRSVSHSSRGAGIGRKTNAVSKVPTHCSTCNLREVCLPCGLNGHDTQLLDDLIYTRKRIRRGDTLYRAGGEFDSLFAIRSGFFKSSMILEDGRDQVTGFHMAGEVLGTDGIGSGNHSADVIALEDSEVCVIPYQRLDEPSLQRQLHKVMSRELVRDQGVMMLLGTMRADERLCAFLLNLSQRFAARGYAAGEFHLRMTREEIGSYLGLSLETVSRLFSRFQDEGLVAVRQKHVRIVDRAGLKTLMSHDSH
jgi:CRP/FNR family transcriptional regulator, anaerobic regulatory protein